MHTIEMTPAILFDFDGTLVDSEGIWLEAKINALLNMGISCEESELREFAGKNLNTVFTHFFADSREHITQKELDVIKANFYKNVDEVALKLVPSYVREIQGAREALQRFKEVGFIIAICSNAPTYFINSTLSFLKLEGLVQGVFSAANTDMGKPNPFVYQNAIDTLGLEKIHTIAVEDSQSGAEAALAAGISVILLKDSEYGDGRANLHNVKSIKDLTPDFVKSIMLDK